MLIPFGFSSSTPSLRGCCKGSKHVKTKNSKQDHSFCPFYYQEGFKVLFQVCPEPAASSFFWGLLWCFFLGPWAFVCTARLLTSPSRLLKQETYFKNCWSSVQLDTGYIQIQHLVPAALMVGALHQTLLNFALGHPDSLLSK